MHPTSLRAALWLLLLPLSASAAGLYQDGAGARAKSMGGAGAAVADDPLSALFDNPAALGSLDRPSAQLAADGLFEHGTFYNRANPHADGDTAGAIGEFAASVPLGPVRLAVGFNPDMAVKARWHYVDTPGGADGATSYGFNANQSEILLLRTAFGVGWQVTRQFSVGANAGLLYNENQLQTPYVFQRQPVLRKVKTLLDLQTDGFGVNGEFGLRWQPVQAVTLSLAYTTPARVETHGKASGNAGVQLANIGLGAVRPDFEYSAQVINTFPGTLSAGVAWQARRGLTLAGQFDWIHWSGAFTSLPVRLTSGNNADFNGQVGSSRLNDDIPLRWGDQYVGRVGVEQALGTHWTVRAGYAYGNNPVPDGTLTPLTAAITEHLLTTGAGYRTGRWRFDASYQWQIPATARVGRSDLADGEYSGSVTSVYIHAVSLTARMEY